jgi:uncharacterized protein (TIGR02271 family)
MDAPELWTAIAALAAAYIVSRGLARSPWQPSAVPAHRPAEADEPIHGAGPPPERSEGSLSAEPGDTATEAEVTLSEERLQVDRRRRPHERVRLRKYVVTEYVTVRVPVKREEVSLERIPIDEDDGEAGDGPELVLMTEEPVIEKHVVARERIRLHKDVMTSEREVTETVRREQAEVERDLEPEPTEDPR